MNELTALVLTVFFKSVTILGLGVGIVYLAEKDKPGWGWLVFLAIIVASTSIKYTKD